MYPADFDYYRAASVEEALELLEEHGPDVEILAGGHSLVPTIKTGLASPDAIVDISAIEGLNGIDVGAEMTTFGALTRYVDIAASEDARETCPTVTAAARAIGDVQVRNRGTIGGNITHSDPASDLPAAVLASDATLVVQGPDGEREVPVDDFFLGIFETAVDEDELLTRIEVPNRPDDGVGVYVKKPSPSSGYAVVGVAAVLTVDDGVVSSARLAANGAFPSARRLEPVEDALVGESLDADTVETAAEAATDGVDDFEFMDDIHTSATFRAQLLRVYTKRALEQAAEQVGEPVATD